MASVCDEIPWPYLPCDPLELALWMNALADRTPKAELLRAGLGDLVERMLRAVEIRAKA